MIFSLFNVTFSLQCEPGTEYAVIFTELSDWYKTSYISHKYCRSLYWALKIPHLHREKLRAYSKALFFQWFSQLFLIIKMFEDNSGLKIFLVGLVLWHNLKEKKIVLILLSMTFNSSESQPIKFFFKTRDITLFSTLMSVTKRNNVLHAYCYDSYYLYEAKTKNIITHVHN